jgi:hypothetical protein
MKKEEEEIGNTLHSNSLFRGRHETVQDPPYLISLTLGEDMLQHRQKRHSMLPWTRNEQTDEIVGDGR